ncbi:MULTISPECIES: type II toxin-antitoxin system VapC family toxin [unclassified Paraburkholderia]|uniref:type II toxin-antitoxin system VapC family toxin n=1 Tax=unclassified Paraburkholderia TaxID=2615204 RepID=UPI00197F9590|nr:MULTISPECIES: type II toxin-antitoxin system VapC family toxin [unclassified Paraburkholderia]MBN3856338.1 type II toxin-antitoxin system VapC family toxin [Paraburkholderia sp. Ac-20340]
MVALDTCALVYWLRGDQALSEPARAAIESALEESEVLISAISLLEVAQFVESGRLALSMDTRRWLATLASLEGVRMVPVDTAIAVRATTMSAQLPMPQRLVVATARTLGVPLVTPDASVRALTHIDTIW